ncbi:MAG: 4-alpha-glucanotransferase, partial [Treponema sp.]
AFSATDVRENGFTNAFLPHTYTQSSVVYTGTHDNTTLRAWLDTLTREDFEVLLLYIYGEKPEAAVLDGLFPAEKAYTFTEKHDDADSLKDELCGELIKMAFFSVSVFAVIPFQDLYAMGKEARINEPSTLGKIWTWSMEKGLFTEECAQWLGNLVIASGRCNPTGTRQ